MTLFEVTKELFSYLVLFRERAVSAAPPKLEEVRQEIEDIFASMEAKVTRQPSLAPAYRQVHYALTAFADEVILSSGWKYASQWEKELLEQKFFGTNVAGDRFFELVGRLDEAPREVVAIYYFCLALGFRGHFSPDDERLQSLKAGLLAKLQRGKTEAADILIRQGYFTSPARTSPAGRLWRWRAPLIVFAAVILAVFLIDRFAVWPWLVAPVSQVSELAQERLGAEKRLDLKTGLEHVRTVAGTIRTHQPPPQKAKPAPPTTSLSAPALPQATPPAQPAAGKARATGIIGRTERLQSRLEGDFKKLVQKAEKDLGLAPKAPPAPKPKPTPTPKAKPAPAPVRGFIVQLGTYNGPVWARRIASRAQKAGYPARVVEAPRPGQKDRTWYVVVVGPYDKRQQAAKVRRQLAQRFHTKPVVLKAAAYGIRPGEDKP